MAEDKLTRDDLVLLMESYRNMITMHQAILEQTGKTIDKLDIIATKQDTLFSKQGNICTSIGDINKNMIEHDKEMVKNLDAHDKATIKDNGKLANKIHLGWIGMGTIILGLIGLIYTIIKFVHTHPTP